ncbi:MAG TPA: hypothetical protein HPQ03_12125 [Deltaproteobacteria bacterium]|nr:hypothetical protein [Deltaproteobacteria bacterium]
MKTIIAEKVPYTMRHTFATWALTLRIDPNKLVNLMGPGSKVSGRPQTPNYLT